MNRERKEAQEKRTSCAFHFGSVFRDKKQSMMKRGNSSVSYRFSVDVFLWFECIVV